jgi:hypothetical protein
MENEKTKDKNIRKEGDKYSVRAIAINVPSRDVAISIKLNLRMRNSEVDQARIRIEEQIQEWWEDSRLMEPFHFIKHIKTPSYPHNRETNMVFLVELSVLSRKIITGKGDGAFNKVFETEVDRLIECLGLEC